VVVTFQSGRSIKRCPLLISTKYRGCALSKAWC